MDLLSFRCVLWQDVVLEELPDKRRCLDCLCRSSPWSRIARPAVTAMLDTIVHHYYACVTVGPLFSRDIGLFEKKTWPCCTAIAGYPGLQPGNDGRINVRATSI